MLKLTYVYVLSNLGLKKPPYTSKNRLKETIALYEKMGFIKEGEMREMLFQNGEAVNLIAYGMLKDEYIKLYK